MNGCGVSVVTALEPNARSSVCQCSIKALTESVESLLFWTVTCVVVTFVTAKLVLSIRTSSGSTSRPSTFKL